MAYKAQINPQSGTSSDKISLILELDSNVETKVRIENATHGVILDEFELLQNQIKVERQFSLHVPEYSSDSMISVLVNISVKEDDTFKLVEVLPFVYHISDITTTLSDSLFDISPSFVSQGDTVKVSAKGKVGDRYVISINDKRFNVIVSPSGFGSIHFKSKDVLVADSEIVPHKFPVYYYSSDDNYISKNFTGSYLSIIPDNVRAAEEDPRCATYDPETWVVPEGCDDTGNPGDPGDPVIPGNEIPKEECDYDDSSSRPCACEEVESSISPDACRNHKTSSALISNGMVLNSYVSVDKTVTSDSASYNKQRVFIKDDNTSLDCQIVASQNVVVLPKTATENFTVYITEELYDTIIGVTERGKGIMAVFMDAKMEYAGFEVMQISDIDEYILYHTLIIDRDDSTIVLNELDSCVFTVFYEIESGLIAPPSVEIPSNIAKLPFIEVDGSEDVVTVTNVSISSNELYRGADGESYVHILAEGYYSGKVQLFYYGFSVGPSGYTSTNSDDWTLLTTDGTNKNAKTVTDKYDNLHVFWESDRTGLDQIYYGVIGPSAIFYTNSTLSSIIDKKAELDDNEDKPFGYLSQDIIESTGEVLSRISDEAQVDEYTGAITYPNKGILSTSWIKNETFGGSVSVNDVDDISDITIESDVSTDTAVAFTTLDKDNLFDLSSGLLSQINYQVSFGFNAQIFQDISGYVGLLTQEDIDDLYTMFKSSYIETIDNNVVNGLPFYVSDNNRFNIGIENEIYDRFIPIMGAYKNDSLDNYLEGDTITDDFTIYASGENRNLNHFFIAVVPEKVRFKVTNIEDEVDFTTRTGSSVSYEEGDTQEHYTGRAALAVIYSTDNSLSGLGLSDITVRNISKPFVLSNSTDIDVLVNYSKMFREDVANFMGIPNSLAEGFPRFACNLTIMMNGNAKFSESFIVDLSDKYRAFDIGLGVTSQGSFKADNFYPYNSSVFENTSVVFNYSDVTISSPTYQFNTDVCSIPSFNREQSELSTYDFYGNEEDILEEFFNNYDFLYDGDIVDPSTGISLGYAPTEPVEDEYGVIPDTFNISTQEAFSLGEFMQIPLTLEGINSNPSISLDFINNIHLTWQSNRDKSWNIFYSSSINKNIPFRFDTPITNTNSNSLSPDISTDETGKRMIVWHDDRNENFEIFAARTLETYNLGNPFCENIDTLLGISVSENPSQSNTQISNSIISFSQSNNDPSAGTLNFHYRVTFYSDANKSRVVYSSFSLIDDKRWYISGSSYDAMDVSGAFIPVDSSLEIIYVPDVFPQQLFSKQSLKLTGLSSYESSLLSGVKYYVDIESYDINTGVMELISEVEFKVDAKDVETNFWREDIDAKKWISSSQGQSDLLVSNSGEQSLFPSVDSNIFGLFYIANQSLRDGSTVITRSVWDAPNDKLFSSGQGLWETEGPFSGQKAQVITDQAQNFYIVSSDDTKFYSYKCPLPSTEDDITEPSGAVVDTGILCFPGTLTQTGSFNVRVRSEDTSGSMVINRDEAVSIIDKTDINIDISGIYGVYAVRLRNQDSTWSDWISVDNNLFIEDNRFLVPWMIPRLNGIRNLCCQVLTVYGMSSVNCIDIFVNMQTVDYFVDYFYDISEAQDGSELELVPTYEGFSLLATKGEDKVIIYVTITFNQPQSFDALKFDVINQGISNVFDEDLTPMGTGPTYLSYTGSFDIRKQDGIFDVDGEGFLKVKFEENSVVDNCVSDRRDLYNQMLVKSELDFLDTVTQTPEDAFKENATRTTLKVLDINEFKQYYDTDDPNLLFGDIGFYRD